MHRFFRVQKVLHTFWTRDYDLDHEEKYQIRAIKPLQFRFQGNELKHLLIFLFFLPCLAEASVEKSLMEECKTDLAACERLGAYYLSHSEWEKTFMIGEALCSRDNGTGCMLAGSARLAQGKIPEATDLLSKACDKFVPLACRSMGRLMEKSNEPALSNMYFKRACFFGLKEICEKVVSSKISFSPAGLNLLANISEDCKDTEDPACRAHLNTIKSCALPLNKLDCSLMAGHLSLFFRAKFMQAEAKLVLLGVYAAQKAIKEAPKSSGHSYDLHRVMSHQKPLENYHYVFGFMKSCGKKYSSSKRVQTNSLQLYPKSYKDFGARTRANIDAYFSKQKAEDCYDSKVGYEAYAVGRLDPLNPTHLDVWKIDQDQRLQNVQDGIPLP